MSPSDAPIDLMESVKAKILLVCSFSLKFLLSCLHTHIQYVCAHSHKQIQTYACDISIGRLCSTIGIGKKSTGHQ